MAGKFEIKAVVTGAQQSAQEFQKIAASAEKTAGAIDKLTAAENRAAKSAQDSAKFFKQLQDAVVDRADQQQYLTGLTAEAKAHTATAAEAEKSTRSKNRLLDAFKKLKAEVPLVGAAVDALKNPLTAVTLAFAVAANWINQFSERVKQMQKEVGDGKLADQFGNIRKALAEASVEGAKFNRVLEEIADRTETVPEKVARLSANLERTLKVEAETDDLAKADELAKAAPADRPAIEARFAARARQRDQRRLAGQANIQAQAQFRARDDAREALAALPGAEADLAQKIAARDRAASEKRIKTSAAEDEIDAISERGLFARARNLFIYESLDEAEKFREMLEDSVEGAGRFNGNMDARQTLAQGAVDAAQQSVNDLRNRAASSLDASRTYGIARGAAVADASAFQPFNDPAGARFGADSRAAQAAFEEFIRRVILITNEGQQRVDALSRQSAAQSQQ